MCWKCGKDIKEESISRTSTCGFCSKDLHCCRNCVFYSPGSHYDCRETVEEVIVDKEKSNFCDFFKVKRLWLSTSGNSSDDKVAAAKKAFDSLFS